MVKTLHLRLKSAQDIAAALDRPRHMILYYVAELKGAVRIPRMGPKRILSKTTERAIGSRVSNADTSSTEVIGELGLNVSRSTVKRVIRRCPYIHREKKLRAQLLGPIHMTNRLASAMQRRNWIQEWFRIIFSDEKKWNLDGPDNACYYFHDIRKPKRYRGHRQAGGGSVMTWGGFGCHGKTPIVFISGNQNSVDYQNTLDEFLSPVFDDLADHPSIFQQDGASIHTAHSTMAWFFERRVLRLQWPSRSPDLNPMENLWAILEQTVYHNGKIYSHVADLKVAITAAWAGVTVATLRHLVESMPRRMQAVIVAKGGPTKY